MSAYSPIQRLDYDILWCIIQINADMFNYDGALETTLATSRVCRNWRNFMLSTDSIWAHLVDLDHRLWRTAEGSTELIRRSGTALLWMKLHYYMYRPHDRIVHVPNILGKHLDQVQRLEVSLTCKYGDQWSLVYVPAVDFESFSITLEHESYRSNIAIPIHSSLFGGSVPLLRELRFRGHRSDFTIPPSSWLQQLRSLDLRVGLTVSEMLGILRSTINVDNLRLHDMLANDHANSTLSLVSLPKLAHLDMHFHVEGITAGAVLLDHICIPPTCSLNFSIRWMYHTEIDQESTFAAIIRLISTPARASFTHHAPQNLGLTITQRHFTFETTTHSDGPAFRFSMELAPPHVFPKHALPILLSEFSLPYFSKVTSLRIGISGVHQPVPEIATFMACLPSVNTIKTDKWSLRHLIRTPANLNMVDTEPKIAFPTLQILDIRSLLFSRAEKFRFDNYPEPVSKFVMTRIAHGHAISVVDFTEHALNALPHLEFMRKAVGLKSGDDIELRGGLCISREWDDGEDEPTSSHSDASALCALAALSTGTTPRRIHPHRSMRADGPMQPLAAARGKAADGRRVAVTVRRAPPPDRYASSASGPAEQRAALPGVSHMEQHLTHRCVAVLLLIETTTDPPEPVRHPYYRRRAADALSATRGRCICFCAASDTVHRALPPCNGGGDTDTIRALRPAAPFSDPCPFPARYAVLPHPSARTLGRF
ncbi:hypothetical protein HYPSUDRAFT_204642 [Hypholoma sublateritium FD-334 SS-4]|uniref:F-box domain-containing protein n=1 Tax=Hypholoma sublateritium (strain FD-334 SS-4) TaxID=945553 RepID=A0A0D2KY20_HYPSF|nr:hypothetical protein HYPSUDRAFT_204642 [Hypholoma sublateritium FD-334 SS-4]